MNPDNAWGLCITAAAGTELATSYSPPTLKNCSAAKAVYNPKAFILHAASLDQAFAHCPIFPTAASRRSRGRVAVPVWRYTLSGPLTVIGLVSHYLTNYLMVRRPSFKRRKALPSTYLNSKLSEILFSNLCLDWPYCLSFRSRSWASFLER